MATAFETYMELEMGARAPFLFGDIDPNTSIDPVIISAPSGVFYRMLLPEDHHKIFFKEVDLWIELLRKDDLPASLFGVNMVEVSADYSLTSSDTHLNVDSSASIINIELEAPPTTWFREVCIKPKQYLNQIRVHVIDPLTQTIDNGVFESDTEIFISSPGEVLHLIGNGSVWEVW